MVLKILKICSRQKGMRQGRLGQDEDCSQTNTQRSFIRATQVFLGTEMLSVQRFSIAKLQHGWYF